MKVTIIEGTAQEVQKILPTIGSSQEDIDAGALIQVEKNRRTSGTPSQFNGEEIFNRVQDSMRSK